MVDVPSAALKEPEEACTYERIIVDAALRLQNEGAEKFVKSWNELIARIGEKSKSVAAG